MSYDKNNDIWCNTWHADVRGQQQSDPEVSRKTYERNVLGWMQNDDD